MGNKFRYHVGVDPAWKNLGVSIVKEDISNGEIHLVASCVMNPSTYKNIPEFVTELWNWIVLELTKTEEEPIITSVTIERFVAYAGVSTSETENICMIIGALQYLFKDTQPLMLRAIDWKMALVKALHVQKGFENPSPKLDKKFSIAAAEACLNEKKGFLKTDHESDATCLACYRLFCK